MDVEPHVNVQYSAIVVGLIITAPFVDANAIGGLSRFNIKSMIK
ncbi:hypothetical protein [Vulcanisaeta sp. JCM 16159]